MGEADVQNHIEFGGCISIRVRPGSLIITIQCQTLESPKSLVNPSPQSTPTPTQHASVRESQDQSAGPAAPSPRANLDYDHGLGFRLGVSTGSTSRRWSCHCLAAKSLSARLNIPRSSRKPGYLAGKTVPGLGFRVIEFHDDMIAACLLSESQVPAPRNCQNDLSC